MAPGINGCTRIRRNEHVPATVGGIERCEHHTHIRRNPGDDQRADTRIA